MCTAQLVVAVLLYGRGQPRHVTVAESEKRRKDRTKDARRRAAETLKRRREDPVPADDDIIADE